MDGLGMDGSGRDEERADAERRTRAAVDRWHAAVNAGEPAGARRVVAGRVVVSGPRGTVTVDPDGFAAWVTRSGIRLRPLAYHAVGDALAVVEQDASWPGSGDGTRVATVFRVSGGLVSAALRFPEPAAAREFAAVYAALAATEAPA